MPSFNLIKYFWVWEGKGREMGREREREEMQVGGMVGAGRRGQGWDADCPLRAVLQPGGPGEGLPCLPVARQNSCQSWGDCWCSEGYEAAPGSAPVGSQVWGSMRGLTF